MSELKGVMIGAGFFAQFHAEAWQLVHGARVVAVADVDSARAREFGSKWGLERAYASAEEMIKRERPDFVDIVTRPSTHVVLTELAAGAGAAVICQKPMAPTLDEARAMVDAAAASGVRLIVHENWRWQPWYRELARMAEVGEFGTIFHLGFRMRTGDGRGDDPYTTQPYFREMERLLIYETLVHFIDTFRMFAGDIATVNCSTQRVNPVIRGEDSAVIAMRFQSGATGLIDANRISGPRQPEVAFGEFRLEGDRAMARVTPDGSVWMQRYGGEERLHEFSKPMNGYKGDSVFAFQQHAVDCLRTQIKTESEGDLYLKNVATVEACYRSAERGTVEVAE